MLITGHHRLLADEHHAAAKARRKRIRLNERAIRIRKQMSRSLGLHLNNNSDEGGTIWE